MTNTAPALTAEIASQINDALAPLAWEERLSVLRGDNQGRIAFSTSFSYEDQAITHAIADQGLDIDVFTLDTGRLFPETYDVIQKTQDKYAGLGLQVFAPDAEAVQQWMQDNGVNGFYDSLDKRKSCCGVRKVEPLNRALNGASFWVTGLRREHSDNRGDMPVAEFDPARGLIKINPLIDVEEAAIKSYISSHSVPYNDLHDQNFPSIGCAPCTRAVKEGEHPRAGRWWWEQDNKQECGLHVVDGKLVRIKKH